MLRKSVQKLMAEANAVIDTISIHDALNLQQDPTALLIDIREHHERERSGIIPDSVHAPRSHLEFHADPGAALHDPELASGKKLVLFCASGGRSTLAAKTLIDMGINNVAHIAGGFGAWKESGGPIVDPRF